MNHPLTIVHPWKSNPVQLRRLSQFMLMFKYLDPPAKHNYCIDRAFGQMAESTTPNPMVSEVISFSVAVSV